MKKSSSYNIFLFLLTTGIVLLPTIKCSAQEKCGTMSLYNQMLKDKPFLKHTYDSLNTIIMQRAKAIHTNKTEALIRIPIVVHLIGDDVINTISPNNYERVHQQIDILNEDYRKTQGTNGDGNGVDVEIEFCLATRDEDGNVTDGINEIAGVHGPYTKAYDATIKGLIHWDPTKYLNLYVIVFSNSSLGYTQLPTQLTTTPELDGVVIGSDCFGLSGDAKYGSGRTATHEIGHWLNLHHTWGDGDGIYATCADDDGIDDTPVCFDAYGSETADGCPAPPECTNENTTAGFPNDIRQIENYMDYSDDLCMNMFTQGQADVMQATLATLRSGISNLAVTECDGIINVPHCSNGIFDADETGIDCGGYDCFPCIPHCFNGIQDNGETGIDCGGTDCAPCAFGNHCYNFIKDYDETAIDCGGNDCYQCNDLVFCGDDDPFPIFKQHDMDVNGNCGWWGNYNFIPCLNPIINRTGSFLQFAYPSIQILSYIAREYSTSTFNASKYIEIKPLSGCSDNKYVEFKYRSLALLEVGGFVCVEEDEYSAYVNNYCFPGSLKKESGGEVNEGAKFIFSDTTKPQRSITPQVIRFNNQNQTVIKKRIFPEGDVVISQPQSVHISPNITSNIVQFELTDKVEQPNVSISVLNILGQQLLSITISGYKSEINLAQLPSGFYFLRFSNDHDLGTYPVIKQ